MQVLSIQGDTLDAIAWRVLGVTDGKTEAILAANHRISEIGVILPVGTLIEIPTAVDTNKTKQTIKLWD